MRLLIALAAALLLTAPAAAAERLSHDVNGDGLDDVALPDDIGSIDNDGATVLFGTRDRSVPTSRREPGAQGFRIVAGGSNTLGEAEVIGDVNGDGRADVIATVGDAGIYVIWGKADGATVSLDNPGFEDGTVGVGLPDADAIWMGGAGDVNGDGLADLLHVYEARKYYARVRFGSRSAPLRSGFRIKRAGRITSTLRPHPEELGDLNGDGLDDVGLAVADPNGRQDGFDVEDVVFVVWGKRGTADVTITQGRRSSSARVLSGGRPAGRAVFHKRRGCACSASEFGPAGDLNGDGRGDLAILWEAFARGQSDRVDVLFGSRASRPAFLPGRGGAVVTGATAFEPVIGWGDRNADGRDDLLFGADRPTGLRFLSGTLARGTRRAGSLGNPLIRGSFGVGRVAGDMDGDGQLDLLLGQETFEGEGARYAIAYGSNPQRPLAFGSPGPDLVRIP